MSAADERNGQRRIAPAARQRRKQVAHLIGFGNSTMRDERTSPLEASAPERGPFNRAVVSRRKQNRRSRCDGAIGALSSGFTRPSAISTERALNPAAQRGQDGSRLGSIGRLMIIAPLPHRTGFVQTAAVQRPRTAMSDARFIGGPRARNPRPLPAMATGRPGYDRTAPASA